MAFTATLYAGQSNRGVDRKIRITRNDTGASIQLGGRLASIEFSDKDSVEETDGIDNQGLVDHQREPGGVQAMLTINRYNGDIEQFMKGMDSVFYSGQNQVYATIVITTYNGFDMSINTDTLTMCVLSKLKSGPFQNKQGPKVTFSVDAQQRL